MVRTYSGSTTSSIRIGTEVRMPDVVIFLGEPDSSFAFSWRIEK
jgi:hypothetical protein